MKTDNKIPYPFEFDEIRLTDEILEGLGLKEWYGGAGDYHDGNFQLGGLIVRLHNIPEEKDDSQGYGTPIYQAAHFSNEDFKRNLYFLHDLYEEILRLCEDFKKPIDKIEVIKEFTLRCHNLNLGSYLKSYQEYKYPSNIPKSYWTLKDVKDKTESWISQEVKTLTVAVDPSKDQESIKYSQDQLERYVKFHTFLTNLAYHRRGKPEENWDIEDISREARMLIDGDVVTTSKVERNVFEQANDLVALGFYIRVDYERGQWYYIIQKLPTEKDVEFVNSGECQDGDLWLDADTVFNSFPKGYKTHEEALTFGLKDIYEFFPELKSTDES